MLKPYKRLSQVYDEGWGDFSIQYVTLIDELLRERGIKHARILDIACGTGILALELAKCGHTVHGLDISPEMIGVAKPKSTGLPNLSFDIQDMAHFNVDGKFDLVACTFDSINYIREMSDLQEMLFRVASVLNDGGLFIFDSNTKHLYISQSDESHKWEVNGQLFIEHTSYDSTLNEARVSFSFSDGTVELHRQRAYGYDDLDPLLFQAGLNVLHLFSWFCRIPYTSNTAKLFCVAEKNTES